MGQRPSSELLQSLRTTLQKLEESFSSSEDHPQMAELKRILLLRIADLEFVGAAVEKAANREETGPPATVPQGVVAQDDVIQLPILDDPEAA